MPPISAANAPPIASLFSESLERLSDNATLRINSKNELTQSSWLQKHRTSQRENLQVIYRFLETLCQKYGDRIATMAGENLAEKLGRTSKLKAGMVKEIIAEALKMKRELENFQSGQVGVGQSLDAALDEWLDQHYCQEGLGKDARKEVKADLIEQLQAARPYCRDAKAMFEAVRAGKVEPLQTMQAEIEAAMSPAALQKTLSSVMGYAALPPLGADEVKMLKACFFYEAEQAQEATGSGGRWDVQSMKAACKRGVETYAKHVKAQVEGAVDGLMAEISQTTSLSSEDLGDEISQTTLLSPKDLDALRKAINKDLLNKNWSDCTSLDDMLKQIRDGQLEPLGFCKLMVNCEVSNARHRLEQQGLNMTGEEEAQLNKILYRQVLKDSQAGLKTFPDGSSPGTMRDYEQSDIEPLTQKLIDEAFGGRCQQIAASGLSSEDQARVRSSLLQEVKGGFPGEKRLLSEAEVKVRIDNLKLAHQPELASFRTEMAFALEAAGIDIGEVDNDLACVLPDPGVPEGRRLQPLKQEVRDRLLAEVSARLVQLADRDEPLSRADFQAAQAAVLADWANRLSQSMQINGELAARFLDDADVVGDRRSLMASLQWLAVSNVSTPSGAPLPNLLEPHASVSARWQALSDLDVMLRQDFRSDAAGTAAASAAHARQFVDNVIRYGLLDGIDTTTARDACRQLNGRHMQALKSRLSLEASLVPAAGQHLQTLERLHLALAAKAGIPPEQALSDFNAYPRVRHAENLPLLARLDSDPVFQGDFELEGGVRSVEQARAFLEASRKKLALQIRAGMADGALKVYQAKQKGYATPTQFEKDLLRRMDLQIDGQRVQIEPMEGEETEARNQRLIAEGYQRLARFCFGEQAEYERLTPEQKNQVWVLAGACNQIPEGLAASYATGAAAPALDGTGGKQAECSMVWVASGTSRSFRVERDANNDVVVSSSIHFPAHALGINDAGDQDPPELDATRSGLDIELEIAIPQKELERVASLNWTEFARVNPNSPTLPGAPYAPRIEVRAFDARVNLWTPPQAASAAQFQPLRA